MTNPLSVQILNCKGLFLYRFEGPQIGQIRGICRDEKRSGLVWRLQIVVTNVKCDEIDMNEKYVIRMPGDEVGSKRFHIKPSGDPPTEVQIAHENFEGLSFLAYSKDFDSVVFG